MIRNEDGLLTGYVYVDVAGRDPAATSTRRAALVREKVTLPPGYALLWSGQYEAMQRVRERLAVRRPAHAVPHPAAALPEHAVAREDGDRRAGGAVLGRSAPSGSCTCSATT